MGDATISVVDKDGQNGEPQEQDGTGRDEKGRFLPGVSGNPGGRPPRPDFYRVFAKVAERLKMDQEELLAEVVLGMVEGAKLSDAACGRQVLDRMFGPVLQRLAEVNIDNRSVHIGPPVPSGGELSEHIKELGKVAGELLKDGDPSGT